ncbi:hypothetical protein GCM10009801_43480 [Streptomyces albiaxialis]|uniref:Thiamine pyrophosphate enzyme TPP-binding domain-containing protein n=2 Tax=Streptomyces albiaxialis TaxID=329523 RepID=A0ABN2W4E7_9ACTN
MTDVIQWVAENFTDAGIVSTNGLISRDLHSSGDRERYFYLVGSMGMAGPIGLGIALAQQRHRTVVLDGDGSFYMNLSCLPLIGRFDVDLIHLVLDNQLHESTGGQRHRNEASPCDLALSAGYRSALRVSGAAALPDPGSLRPPVLVHIDIPDERGTKPGRVAVSPPDLTQRMSRYLATPHSAEGRRTA